MNAISGRQVSELGQIHCQTNPAGFLAVAIKSSRGHVEAIFLQFGDQGNANEFSVQQSQYASGDVELF